MKPAHVPGQQEVEAGAQRGSVSVVCEFPIVPVPIDFLALVDGEGITVDVAADDGRAAFMTWGRFADCNKKERIEGLKRSSSTEATILQIIHEFCV